MAMETWPQASSAAPGGHWGCPQLPLVQARSAAWATSQTTWTWYAVPAGFLRRLVCSQYRTCLQLASQCCVSTSRDWGTASVQEFSGRVMQLLAHQPVDEVISVLGTLLCKPDSHAPCFIYVTRVRKQNTGVSKDPVRCLLDEKAKSTHHTYDL